jgi:transcriptional regulator with XRE-family HTH domain
MTRAFQSQRLRGLLQIKGIRPDQVKGFSREMIAKWENGHGQPSLEGLRDLAAALDSTIDYLIGLGDDYGESCEVAAARMSYAYFDRDPSVQPALKKRCLRIAEDDEVLKLEGAPRTVDQWKTVARMVDLATPSPPVRFDTVRRG